MKIQHQFGCTNDIIVYNLDWMYLIMWPAVVDHKQSMYIKCDGEAVTKESNGCVIILSVSINRNKLLVKYIFTGDRKQPKSITKNMKNVKNKPNIHSRFCFKARHGR